MNASLWTVIAVVGVLCIKIFSWYVDKPRRIRELKARENAILEDLRYATIHLDTRRMAILERELNRVRKDIADLM